MKGRKFWLFWAEKYFSGQIHRIQSHFIITIIVFERAIGIWKLDSPHKNAKSSKIGVLPMPTWCPGWYVVKVTKHQQTSATYDNIRTLCNQSSKENRLLLHKVLPYSALPNSTAMILHRNQNFQNTTQPISDQCAMSVDSHIWSALYCSLLYSL